MTTTKTRQEVIEDVKRFFGSDGGKNFNKCILDWDSLSISENCVSVEYKTTDGEEAGRINLEYQDTNELIFFDVDIYNW